MRWFTDRPIATKLVASFLAVLSLVAALSVITSRAIRRSAEAERWTRHTYTVLGEVDNTLLDLVNMETGYRGYLVAGQEEFLAPYRSGIEGYQTALATLDSLTADNPGQLQRWSKVRNTAQAWRDSVTEPTIARRRAAGADLAAAAEASVAEVQGAGKEYFDAMRAVLAEAAVEEQRLLAARAESQEADRTTLQQTLLWGTLLVIVLGVFIGFTIARSIARRIREVMERTNQLNANCVTELGSALDAMSRGDLTAEVTPTTGLLTITTADEVGELGRTINAMISRTQATVASYKAARAALTGTLRQTESLVEAARKGDLRTRASVSGLDGTFRDLTEGLNQTLDAVVAPMQETATVLERLADRDLTARVTGQYVGDHATIKNALNSALDALSTAIREVGAASEQVASAGGQIAGGAQALSQGASEQAAGLEEVSTSVNELDAMAQRSAANAREASGLAVETENGARTGADRMRELAESLEAVKRSGDQTAKIVKSIDEIAFQTNLLALNAAVEAARAGDAGKGFAVVAEEVRALAIRSAEAAKSTAALIDSSVQGIGGSHALGVQVSAAFDDVTQRIGRMTQVVTDIAAAAEQQTDGIRQINSALGQMNGVTQQTAANAEESAAAAEELSAQAGRLQEVVGEFRVDGASAGTSGVHAATPAARQRIPRRARVLVG